MALVKFQNFTTNSDLEERKQEILKIIPQKLKDAIQ